jgi:hypothetical protein
VADAPKTIHTETASAAMRRGDRSNVIMCKSSLTAVSRQAGCALVMPPRIHRQWNELQKCDSITFERLLGFLAQIVAKTGAHFFFLSEN